MAKRFDYLAMAKKAKQEADDHQTAILTGVNDENSEEQASADDVMETETVEDVDTVNDDEPVDSEVDSSFDDTKETEGTSSTVINNTPFLAESSGTALEEFVDEDADDDIGEFVDVPPEPVEMPDDEPDDVPEEVIKEQPSAFERPQVYEQSETKQKSPKKEPAIKQTEDDGDSSKSQRKLSKYDYHPATGLREVPRELVELANLYFPSCNNQSLAVGAYILAHEGFPKHLADTPDIFMEMARTFTGTLTNAGSADTMDDLEDLKTEVSRLRADNKNLLHKLETIEIAISFLLLQYNAAMPTNAQVDKLKFSGDKLDEVMRNLSSAAINKSISDKHDKGRPIR